MTIREPASTPTTARFTVMLLYPTNLNTVTVVVNTLDGTATASNNVNRGDYGSIVNQTLTFAPGTTTVNVDVQINDDNRSENNEAFSLMLSNATNATIFDSAGVCTITP